MNELIVEGLTPGDFLLLQQIITTYNISISSDIDWAQLVELSTKVDQIVKALSTP
jgi:hypothetical protein|tara:strand:- start:272 stop:436 length:165 start_codon:yes stop_codon:yes gene_type:complete